MARERLSMRKLSEVLRLSLEQKLSARKVARSCCLARNTVSDYLARARVVGLSWPLPEGMDEARLEGLLFPAPEVVVPQRPPPDSIYIRNELRRKHVTLQLLWEEYRSHTPNGYGYAGSGSPSPSVPAKAPRYSDTRHRSSFGISGWVFGVFLYCSHKSAPVTSARAGPATRETPTIAANAITDKFTNTAFNTFPP